jgi:hypothetical protein
MGEHLAACADRRPSHGAHGVVLSFALPKNMLGLIRR